MANAATTGPVGNGHVRTYQAPSQAVVPSGYVAGQGATDQQVAIVAVANGQALGIVSTANPGFRPNEPVGVMLQGECFAFCGAAVSSGQYLKADATGRLTPSTGAGDFVVGTALSSTVNPGDELVIFVNPFVR